jgi:hypothetical protein
VGVLYGCRVGAGLSLCAFAGAGTAANQILLVSSPTETLMRRQVLCNIVSTIRHPTLRLFCEYMLSEYTVLFVGIRF